ncbi:Peptidase aspartic [Aspergillus affinis]|uniref:Peptidase aspartic n=1 Tax=Aspergillus affinis TaxID=1070780 RepID=UPI0022FE073B|nr:Peptidase aspartic [Aspergillus affinis]KAI9036772.1 Peptidase aspartic [Aspergillus affinis]
MGAADAVPVKAKEERAMDTIDLGGESVYSYPLQVGVLSLGCPEFNQTFTRGDGVSINATFINSQIFTADMASSYSFGLLENGNSSLHQGTTVEASPGDPYIYLPKSSCDAITSELPTTYDSDLVLYLWNTFDPRYAQIISSPSYLSFEFNKDSLNSANITIKVPFALLNLTLEAPLVKSPKLYFPCMGTDSTPALGRTFLQAAFMAANWSWGGRIGNWILAQAPGPNYLTTNKLTNIMEKDMTIPGTTNSWEETWANYWTPIPITSSSATPIPTPSVESDASNDNGTSTGAVVGIAVGCAAVGVFLGVLAWLFITRRQRRNAMEELNQMAELYPGIRAKDGGVYELNARRGPYELGIRHPPCELAGPDH